MSINNLGKTIIEDHEPLRNSFSKIDEQNGVSIYYTCPVDPQKTYKSDIIITHYENMLSQLGDTPWIWIFDSKSFGMKHSLETKTAIGIANLVSDQKYGKNLQKIVIANPTIYIKTAIGILFPFLSSETRKKLAFHKNYSLPTV